MCMRGTGSVSEERCGQGGTGGREVWVGMYGACKCVVVLCHAYICANVRLCAHARAHTNRCRRVKLP